MGDRSSPGRLESARTGPAISGGWAQAGPTTYAGFVLLHSPDFRAMASSFPFDREELLIGRSADCDIVLDNHAVSRMHARVMNRDETWLIEDLDSRNGILVDGSRVSQAALEPLHEVRIGDALFKFVDSEAEAYGAYRLDGVSEGTAPVEGSGLVGGFVIRRLEQEVARIGPTALSCVLLGETGTGKEVFARELHRHSGRPGEFRAINCGAIPHDLLESELFGFKRGAFSGATRDKPGLVRQAHRGTLFLDEIGDMPVDAQVKLLRVLQAREVLPLGATQAVPVDLRVVCATHRDLYRYVQDGKFRGDLFARLNEHTMRLPPLREHKEDIFSLTHAFIARHSSRRLEPSFGFMMASLQYDWPFNVRELESAVKRAAALTDTGVLDAKHLPAAVLDAYTSSDMSRSHPAPLASAVHNVDLAALSERAGAQTTETEFLRGAPTEAKLRELLSRHEGNVAAVGRELGKGRMQVHRWMKKYGVVCDEYRPR